jgi:hypothetical protein
MSLLLLAAVLQTALLAFMIFRIKDRVFGKCGFLMMLQTWVYHGLTEVAQWLYPDRNFIYRDEVSLEGLADCALLMTGVMACFILGYLRFHKTAPPVSRTELVRSLDTSWFLKWQVVVPVALFSFSIAAVSLGNADIQGYWSGGLALQFFTFLSGLAFATVAIRAGGRWFPAVTLAAVAVLSLGNSRTPAVMTTIVGIAAMSRYGIHVRRSAYVIGAIIVLLFTAVISNGRAFYGRLNDQSVTARAATMLQTLTTNGVSVENVLDDFVYRFDGNSFGAMIMDKRAVGYGVTGWDQVAATVSYVVPAFIYKGKADLELKYRNEENYTQSFYAMNEELDDLPTYWTTLLGYMGPYFLLPFAGLCGVLFAKADYWLESNISPMAIMLATVLSVIPCAIEQGPVFILLTLRMLPVLMLLVWTPRALRARAAMRSAPAACS